MKQLPGKKIFLAIVIATVAVVAGIGFYYLGFLQQTRAEKLDQQRINDLKQISKRLNSIRDMDRDRLPRTLKELQSTPTSNYPPISSITDPLTGEPYEYSPYSPPNYTLCATFQTDNRGQEKDYDFILRRWVHPIGRHCFSF